MEILTAPLIFFSFAQLLVHSADLSNLCKRWDIHIQWSHSILAEFFSQVGALLIFLSAFWDQLIISVMNRGISRSIKAYRSLKSVCVIFLLEGMWLLSSVFNFQFSNLVEVAADEPIHQDESKELHRKCCAGAVQAVWGSASFNQGCV